MQSEYLETLLTESPEAFDDETRIAIVDEIATLRAKAEQLERRQPGIR
jgi:hypothetical protein